MAEFELGCPGAVVRDLTGDEVLGRFWALIGQGYVTRAGAWLPASIPRMPTAVMIDVEHHP